MGKPTSIRQVRKQKRRQLMGPLVNNIQDFKAAIAEMRYEVENKNKAPVIHLLGSIFKSREDEEMKGVNFPPWVIGYKINPAYDRHGIRIKGMYSRLIYLKCENEDIKSFTEKELEPVFGVFFDELLDQQAGIPKVSQIATDALLIEQDFMIYFQKQGDSIIVPGGPK